MTRRKASTDPRHNFDAKGNVTHGLNLRPRRQWRSRKEVTLIGKALKRSRHSRRKRKMRILVLSQDINDMTALLWDLGSRKLATPAFPRRNCPELVVKFSSTLLIMLRPWDRRNNRSNSSRDGLGQKCVAFNCPFERWQYPIDMRGYLRVTSYRTEMRCP